MTFGSCDPAFSAVRDVLAESITSGEDLGAAVAVYLDGRCVVDLWGGVADERTGRAWEQDTACVTFSATKAVTATAALLLAERGAVSLDARVTEWWPQFGVHGKDAATGVHFLTHQTGLPAFDREMSVDEAADPIGMAAHLAAQAPEWQPGSAHGYHALTFGWLVGELVRRHSGRTVGDYVRAEIGADLWIGVPPEMVDGLARISAGKPARGADIPLSHDEITALVAAFNDPNSLMQRSTTNPPASFNNPALLTAGWPAAGLVCTARALADFYGRLVAGEILSSDTLRDAVKERVRGPDRTMISESAFGLGYMRPSTLMHLPEAARGAAFGHPGASGALGIGDPDCRLGFAYLPNLTRPNLGDQRAYLLLEAVYAAL
jgi:CubicO group peptidase (beta-lactamase class C family)